MKVFPATDAPYFRRGMISILVFAVAIVFLSVGARWLQHKDLYNRALSRGADGVKREEVVGDGEEGDGGKLGEVESEEEAAGEKVV